MQPHEIKPDTALCTILGYNAQTGMQRAYFNKIIKRHGLNATAIALNIKEEHFDIVMNNISNSKVDKMIIMNEFQSRAAQRCDTLDETAKASGRVDYIEITDGIIEGFCLDDAVLEQFENPEFIDDRIRLTYKMMLIAHRWYDAPCQIDEIPLLIA